MLELIEAAGRT